MTLTFDRQTTARHEAGHVAGLALAGRLPLEARADWPEAGLAGRVKIDWGDDGVTPEAARDIAVGVMCGPLAEGSPLPEWPLDDGQASDPDAEQLALLAKYLKLDAAGWDALVQEAHTLVASAGFKHICPLVEAALTSLDAVDTDELRYLLGDLVTKYHERGEGRMMRHKTVPASAGVATDRGAFAAVAAAYTVDRQKEQIRRGAFTQTIARWQASGRQLPLHWNHDASPEAIVGSVDPASMRETAEGLYVEGQLDLEDSETARQAWRSMKADRVGLSFGYLATKSRERAGGVLELTEIDLFEISVVPAPANPDTRILSLKSLDGEEELRRRCEELGVLGAHPTTHNKAADTRPLRIASFDC
jgi:HK97 family phage prohead protease